MSRYRLSVVVLLVSSVLVAGSARSEECRYFAVLSGPRFDGYMHGDVPEEGQSHELAFDAWLPRWAQRAMASDPDIQETFRLIGEWNDAAAAEDEERAFPMDVTYAAIELPRQSLILVMVHHPITCRTAGCPAYVYARAGTTGRRVGYLVGHDIMVEAERVRGVPVLSADDGHHLCLNRWDGRRFREDDCGRRASRSVYAGENYTMVNLGPPIGDICTQLQREQQLERDQPE